MRGDEPRYAVYITPPADEPLARFGDAWLGSGAYPGDPPPRLGLAGFASERLLEITGDAARYGFHATLRAPFHLAEGCSEEQLRQAVATFAAGVRPFPAPRLVVGTLRGFPALLPAEPHPELADLAARVVRLLHPLARPPAAGDLERRRSAGLTPAQEALLVRWGYPYVFGEWRFHFTLACPMPDGERQRLIAALRERVGPALQPFVVDSLCLFAQADRGAPFRRIARVQFHQEKEAGTGRERPAETEPPTISTRGGAL